MSRRTLLTFVGLRDPYHYEPNDDGRQKGPVLTVLDERAFDRVVLFIRTHRQEQGERLCQALRELHPTLQVTLRAIEIHDSAYHPEILTALRRELTALRQESPSDEYTVSLLSGTAEIHASWVLIAASGEFPLRLLNSRRSVHNGIAGPRSLRELNWTEPLSAIKPGALALLEGRASEVDDSELHSPASRVPRHFFVRRSLEQAVLLSRHASPLLISGEPGTQKHYMAALIHQLSNRSGGPLLMLNCATVPDNLFETVLFGEPGEEEAGKVHQADAGTLVLLKIQHVPGPVLARLFKASDDGYYYGAVSHFPKKVNVRIIGTTDRDLDAEVRHERFSGDIWRRLQSSIIRLPPLRERPGDITLLAHDELERVNRTLARPKRFSPGALARLESHAWPSNVSELRRVVEQAVVNAEQTTIQADDIDLDLAVNIAHVYASPSLRIRDGFSMEQYLRAVKHELVRSALRKTGGNQSQAARLLGVTPQAVSKILRSLKDR